MVRLRRGDFSDRTVYSQDPLAALEGWRKAGAPLVHVVDLGGARTGKPDRSLWARLGAAGAEFQVGGGIRSAADAGSAVAAGARRVVIGTAVVWRPAEVAAIVERVGRAKVVVAVDVADGIAKGSAWKDQGQPIETVVQAAAAAGVYRLLVTAIARDGMLTGPDIDLLARVRDMVPDADLIASGGVGSLGDLQAVRNLGADAAVVGRALYEGRFTYAEAAGL